MWFLFLAFQGCALALVGTSRPYRAGPSVIDAFVETEDNAGTQFCRQVVAAPQAIWRTNPKLLPTEQPPQLDAA